MKCKANDLTVIIPYSYDHNDRLVNLQVAKSWWAAYFDCTVIVGEMNTHTVPDAVGLHYNGIMHRTKAINDLTRLATTPYVVNWDCDVICSPWQVVDMLQRLRNGSDICYPYDGTFYWGDRGIVEHWNKRSNMNYYLKHRFPAVGATAKDRNSYGGAVGYNVEAFFAAGGENENLVSYAPEDQERWWRFNMLGLNVQRSAGALYHINHWRGPNSSERHQHGRHNATYYANLRMMNKEQLIQHIKTWTWLR